MNQLLRQLSKKNNFNFAKVEPSQIPNDRFDLEKPLVKFVQETKKVNLVFSIFSSIYLVLGALFLAEASLLVQLYTTWA